MIDVERYSSLADHALTFPSATATFSTLFSLHNSRQISENRGSSAFQVIHRPIKSKLPSKGPHSLPTETLMLIFQFVFESCVDWSKTGTLGPEHAIIWLEDDPLSASLFPYSLASVCIRWLHILSCEEVYWTRQVVTVDSVATSLIMFQNALQWVGSRPLQLIIKRHPTVHVECEENKPARIQAVLNLLHPYIHQIWSLTLDVTYSSFLSALPRDEGDAQYLSALTLLSDRSNTSNITDLPPVLHHTASALPTAPSLEGALDDSLFSGALVSEGQQELCLCDTTSSSVKSGIASNERRISLQKFITTVQSLVLLQTLTVEDIAFVNDLHPLHRFCLEAPTVCLRNITDGDAVGSILSQSFGGRSKEAVIVSNCPFSGFGKRSSFRRQICSTNLTLEGLDAGTSAIRQLVCFWNGENLSLMDCPGVSASFLTTVPAKETPQKLRRLRIVDCENISAEGLIKLVRLRELQSVLDMFITHDVVEEPCEALVELRVHGRGPSIGTEQAVWLSEHLDTFSWDTVGSNGTRYRWDASSRELIVSSTYN